MSRSEIENGRTTRDKPACGRPDAEAGLLSVPIWIESPMRLARARQPVALGVCLPRGVLTDAESLCLERPDGEIVTVQAVPLARWPDGSIQWLLVDFLLESLQPGRYAWILAQESPETMAPERPAGVQIRDAQEAVVVDTGPCRFSIDRKMFRPFAAVQLAPSGNSTGFSSRMVLVDAKGRSCEPLVETIQLETQGLVRTTLGIAGRFAGTKEIRFRARLCFFAGTGLVRIRFTVHNPSRARHRGGLWDLGDPGSFYFQNLHLALLVHGKTPQRVHWKSEVEGSFKQAPDERLDIYQDSSGGENWRCRNHVNSQGRVPCRFRGYRVRTMEGERFGLRASPVVALETQQEAVCVAVPEFWQQFPKALETTAGQLRVHLFPCQGDDLFELQGGEQKTHTIWLAFTRCSHGSWLGKLDWVYRPARACPAPGWVAACGALRQFVMAEDDADDRLASLLETVLQGNSSFFARREIVDEYGWRNFGEIYADHEAANYHGPPPVISHYNNQYDMVYGLLVQFLRTGDATWFDLADPLARHVIDIDRYHTDQDKPAYNGGLFWPTDHYRDAATATHRTYAQANREEVAGPYGGGPSDEHNYTTGLLHYYYLTGEPAAREAVIGLADWVIGMDDGRRGLLGLIDHGPTGLASQTVEPGYHGPGRGGGNSINALLDAWLLTRRPYYLSKAEELIRRCIHPADDITAHDLLDVERRWSYTVFLSVLARYLDVKTTYAAIDRMYAYAQRALLHYARWMVEHEQAYFDHPEKLEYPTETWAAQELRKANVLRLAARHADEALRNRLLDRGLQFAERAWSDLDRFETRASARAVAILMIEGVRDAYFRQRPLQLGVEAREAYDFGPPQRFVPQRLRTLGRWPLRFLQALSNLLFR